MVYDDKCHKLGKLTTNKEDEIIKLLCLGKSRLEIASSLEKSPNTVKNQIVSICEKWGVFSSSEIVAAYINQKLQENFNTTLEEIL